MVILFALLCSSWHSTLVLFCGLVLFLIGGYHFWFSLLTSHSLVLRFLWAVLVSFVSVCSFVFVFYLILLLTFVCVSFFVSWLWVWYFWRFFVVSGELVCVCVCVCWLVCFNPLYCHNTRLVESWFPDQKLGLSCWSGSTESRTLDPPRTPDPRDY